MELHELISVSATAETNVYVALVDITDVNGERYVTEYGSRPGDTFGLAPLVRAAVEQWITDGRLVAPYVPPSPDELRAGFPTLSPRQVRLGLLSIGITEGAVESALVNDPEALIEWRYATSIERQHPLVASLGEHFELPAAQIDTLWLWAAAL